MTFKREVAAILFFSSSMVLAGTVTLTWDPSSTPTVTGYKIHFGPTSGITSGTYPNVVDVGNVLTTTIPNIPDTTFTYFAATAYDAAGNKSGFSNEVYRIPAPTNLRIITP